MLAIASQDAAARVKDTATMAAWDAALHASRYCEILRETKPYNFDRAIEGRDEAWRNWQRLTNASDLTLAEHMTRATNMDHRLWACPVDPNA